MLAVLCVTEIVSYGVLFYAFPVLAAGITADTGWSTGTITAAFSLALVVSALVGIPVGRVLDRVGPRAVMTAGSVLAVPAVLGVASARSLPWFAASWGLAGVAMGGVFYPPAFAALTRWWGPAGHGRERPLGRRALRRLSGLVAAPTALATALAPWAGAAAAEALGGYPVVFGLLAGIAVVAAGLAVGSVPAGPGPVRSGSRPARAR